MPKTILITGATDGIGLETAKLLAQAGHSVLLHGRSEEKLAAARDQVEAVNTGSPIATYRADLSTLAASAQFADQILREVPHLDVLINNAGIFTTPQTKTADGLDMRFAVNTFAPYILARRLGPLIGPGGRIINLSSAGQSTVEDGAIEGALLLPDFDAYTQSKLAITQWTRTLADEFASQRPCTNPIVVAVNPGSLLASKMVKEAFGTPGKDLAIGAEILVHAALSPEFDGTNGFYFDNDSGRFADPHSDALDPAKNAAVVERIEQVIATLLG